MPVTSMQPGRKVLGTLISREIGLGVGPIAQRGLDEALGLAIGFRRVGLGAQVLDFEQPQCLRVTTGSEAGAVVGHDAIDLDAMGPEEAQRVKEKAQAGSTFFIGQDFRISDAGGVVCCQMQRFPTDPSAVAFALAISGDARAPLPEASQLLDIDM